VNADVAKYLTQQVMTASPAKLVSMLYDKAITSLREAIAAIEAGDIEARWKANAKALEIISHMWSTLDVEKGGEIAENLSNLFSFMIQRLPEVDFKNDPEPAREAILLLEPLRDAWRELVRNEHGGTENRRPAAPADNATTPHIPTSISA
jgi:flagellar protein FliS